MKHLTCIILSCLLLCACSDRKIVKSDNTDSLEFWTDDTVFYANPRLVRMMDTLYRYTRSETYPATNVQRDINWMKWFRGQVCAYYSDTRRNKIMSQFTMADSVLAETRALYELSEDPTTTGLIVSNGIEYSRLIFEHFNEFGKLYNSCTTDEQRDILTREFEAWRDIEKAFYQLYTDCVELYYWGGSICGPLRSAGALEIKDSHIDLYRRELPDGPGSVQGEYSGPSSVSKALAQLLEACRAIIPDSENTDPDSEEYSDGYYETAQEAEEFLAELPDGFETWLKVRREWEQEMGPVHKDTNYPRNTAQLLSNLTNVINALTEE